MFLTLRDVKAHKEMIELFQRMPEPLQRARIVREQYGFALNREGKEQEATAVLKAVIDEFGTSSETNGLLGRVYKDQWDAAKKAGAGALQVRGCSSSRPRPISPASRPTGVTPIPASMRSR